MAQVESLVAPAIQVFECPTWDEFRKALGRERFGDVGVTLWRGQGDRRWPLASSLDRALLDPATARKRLKKEELTQYRRLRQELLTTFTNELVGLGHPTGSTGDVGLEAAGRHHGMLTPLLDWTEKPFIGAFFAASDLLERVSHLGGTKAPDIEATLFELDVVPELLEAGFRYYPGRSFPGVRRLHAQYGALTSLPEDKGFLDVEDFVETMVRASMPCLTKYHLSSEAARAGVADLRQHGMSFRTLFPDEEGAAREANWAVRDLLGGINLLRELEDSMRGEGAALRSGKNLAAPLPAAGDARKRVHGRGRRDG